MNWLWQLVIVTLAASSVMTLMWLVQCRTRKADVVDIAWTFGTGVAAIFYAATSPGYANRRVLVGALVALWALRLGVYLAVRVLGKPEEGRYARLREHWGAAANRKLFWFFQAQALGVVVFSLPGLAVGRNPAAPLGWLDGWGAAVWLTGMAGVTLADWQLARFKENPANRGHTCQAGLWRYSRHPNYFFEWLLWCGYVPLAVGTAWWWAAAAVPLVLLVLFFYGTGIPQTEKQALASRGDEYRRYQQTTSVFIPWFRKASEAQ